MNISVVICTYNRSKTLAQTLQGFCKLSVAQSITWELLVIDNNSTDATRDICGEFNDKLPLRYVFESRQGKSHALNRALVEATGELLVFTDDDVDVSENWLSEYWGAMARHPNAGFFGGKIIPRWEVPPPPWMESNSKTVLREVAVSLDLGDVDCPLGERVFGANLGLRKTALQQAGLKFRTDIGPCGNAKVGGEETFFIHQLMDKGFCGVYLPGAIIYHRTPAERMTIAYVRKWFDGIGRSEVRTGWIPASKNVWFGAPRYLWRQWLVSSACYLLTRFTRPSAIWLGHQCRMFTKWGAICEFRQPGR
jgi:hypothetical protein